VIPPAAAPHECAKGRAFEEVSVKLDNVGKTLGDLTIEMTRVADRTGNLEAVSKEMSTCIKALTESTIRLQENVITRDQFYGKIEEIQDKSNAAQQAMCDACNTKHNALEARLDATDGKATKAAEIAKGHTWQLRWIWGLLASILGGAILLGLGLLFQHLAGRGA
jgi:hypothetical protein